MQIILGAGKTVLEGWISTQEEDLNLLDKHDFEKQFQENSYEDIGSGTIVLRYHLRDRKAAAMLTY